MPVRMLPIRPWSCRFVYPLGYFVPPLRFALITIVESCRASEERRRRGEGTKSLK